MTVGIAVQSVPKVVVMTIYQRTFAFAVQIIGMQFFDSKDAESARLKAVNGAFIKTLEIIHGTLESEIYDELKELIELSIAKAKDSL